MIITEKTNTLIPCIRCGKEFLPTMLYNFTGEDGYCLDCFLSIQAGRAILDHGYQPLPTFCHMSTEKEDSRSGRVFKRRRKLLYMGIELEIEHRSMNVLQYSYDLQKKYPIYIKHDGSLQNGLELVSHPQTAKYHQKVFNWYELLKMLRKDKWSSYDNGRCGLHIHVNKNFFSNKDDILKLVLFFHKCFAKIKRFAKRRNRDCADFCKKWEESLVQLVKSYKGSVPIYENNSDRYSCINLQNRDTVEFRIYRGTLNYDRFLATIIFTDALCNFIKNYSIAFFANDNYKTAVLWGKFIEYVKTDDKYIFLKKYFKENDLDNNKVPKATPPPLEDYQGKNKDEDCNTKVEFTTVKDLITLCQSPSLRGYIVPLLEYEFTTEEFPAINFADSINYYIFNVGGLPNFIIPKNITRLKLDKEKVSPKKIARMICRFLDTENTFALRVMSGNNLYKATDSARGLLALGGDSGLFSNRIEKEKRVEDFIKAITFKYEIVRSDLIDVYNNM